MQRGPRNGTDRILRADLLTYLPEDLLVKMDRATMANALEARAPLLDHKVVEFAATLPTDRKIKGSHDQGPAPGDRQAADARRDGRSTQDGLRRAHRGLVPRRAGRSLSRAGPRAGLRLAGPHRFRPLHRGCWPSMSTDASLISSIVGAPDVRALGKALAADLSIGRQSS